MDKVQNRENIILSSSSRSRVSSGSVVSDYGLDDRAIDVRSPTGAKDFSSSLRVQTGSRAHRASCTTGTGGPFPGAKVWPGRDADHSPHPVPRSWMSMSYTSSPPWRFHGVLRDCFVLHYGKRINSLAADSGTDGLSPQRLYRGIPWLCTKKWVRSHYKHVTVSREESFVKNICQCLV
jgi:hypothetical protein